LVDTAATFVTLNVKAGDVVYNTTSGTAATVVSVTSETVLVLNANIFTAIGQTYVVYNNSAQTTIPNTGCVLYVGGAGNVNLVTIDGDTVLFNAVPAGSFLPIQVKQVLSSSTTATLINALW
jgi:RNase P/RNase MRP subunit p29